MRFSISLGRSLVLLGIFGLSATTCFADPPQLYQEYPSPNEPQEFAQYAQEIQDIQLTLAKGTSVERAFHSKAHGCLQGTFQVLPNIEADLQYGIFTPGASYPVTGRFSNASGHAQADTERDMRGLALKLTQVGPDKNQVQDFLGTNGPVHFAKDAAGMMAFGLASSQGVLAMGKYFLTNLKGAAVLLHDTSQKVPSMTTQSFWSRVPFKIGPKAMKFKISPCSNIALPMPAHPSATYLTDDLRTRAAAGPLCFTFSMQLQLDPVKQPIEDASVEWMESDTPFIPVATITFPAQTFDSTEQLQACNDMSFSPWNHLPDLRPLGNMNRARKVVYPSSASFRGAKQ